MGLWLIGSGLWEHDGTQVLIGVCSLAGAVSGTKVLKDL